MAVPEKVFIRPKGAPMWIVTFTDMISLLLTFFIMILTFSSMEEEKLNQVSGALAGAFGVMSKPGMPARTEIASTVRSTARDRDNDGVTDPSMRPAEAKEGLAKIQRKDLYNVKIEVKDIEDGVLVSISPKGDAELFVLGSDRVDTWTKQMVKEIATFFKDFPMRFSVETHIDSNTPEIIGEDPNVLTLAMALSVADILVSEGIPPERIAVAPMGDRYPVADNNDPLGRYKNRRLQIRMIRTWREEIKLEKGEN